MRSGCRSNAVLRLVLCEQKGEETLEFGVFALRDLKVGEGIMLGWEWDDGNPVHNLTCAFEDSAYVSVSSFFLLLFHEFNDCTGLRLCHMR